MFRTKKDNRHSHEKYDEKNPGVRMKKGAEAIGQMYGKNSKQYREALKRCR